MIIDVNSPEASINRVEPWTSYTNDYLTRIFGVVEAFKNYPNTMAFFSANEVMNDIDTGKVNPPYIRVRFWIQLHGADNGLLTFHRPSSATSEPTSPRTHPAPFL
jgi:hypothetical protein